MRACNPILLLVALLSFFACRAPVDGGPSTSVDEHDYTLVLLKTGPRREPLADAERAQVFAGHFANMERLARERHLLVAGPFGAHKGDPNLRGLFVLDTDDPARARELAETDPGFQAGVFALEYESFSTAAPLRAFLAAELAAYEAAERAGRKPAPGEGGRGYVLLTVEHADAARRALAGHPAVLWFARLGGSRASVLLDAADVEQARALLAPLRTDLGDCDLAEWFASGRLANLPQLAR